MNTLARVMISVAFLFSSLLLADSEADDIARQQRVAARPRVLYIPYYSIANSDDTQVFMVSKIVDPLKIDIFAASESGEQMYLGQEILPPSRGLRISLRDRLKNSGEVFATGNLRLDYVGDSKTLQAWSVVRSRQQVFEVPFISQEKAAATEFFSFWDTDLAGPRPKVRAIYSIINTTNSAVSFILDIGGGPSGIRRETDVLAPRTSRSIIVSSGETTHRGWLHLTHSGPEGAVIGSGILEGDERLAYLPLLTKSDLEKGPRFEVLRLPVDESGQAARGVPRSAVAVFNPADNSQKVAVSVIEQASGAGVASQLLTVEAWSVADLDIAKLLGHEVPPGLRLRVEGSSSTLAIDGASVTSRGEVLDMSVHSDSTVHHSGTYPIPDLRNYDVRTTIINIGQTAAEIVAQYFWDGGTFAVPIIHVPAGGTAVIDPRKLSTDGATDFLKRKLDSKAANLALKWSRRSGSDQLIGRTEVRPLDTADGFGFNCGGCCWQIPRVAIEPVEVDVGLYEIVPLTSVVYWDSCSGTLGPWYVDPFSTSVPWPFAWDSQYISTSDGADDYVGFEDFEVGYGLDVSCPERNFDLWGWARAKACDKVYNPRGYDPKKQCTEQTSSCDQCISCCDAIYYSNLCKKVRQDLAIAEWNACKSHCGTDIC